MAKQTNNQINDERHEAQKEFNKEMKDSLKEILKEVKSGNLETHNVKVRVEKIELAVADIQKKQIEDKEKIKWIMDVKAFFYIGGAVTVVVVALIAAAKNMGWL
jgi:seryl-tRNA synthetase